MRVRFTWDEGKNRADQQKHGVSFEEAATVFAHWPLAIFHDPDHSDVEDRHVAIGLSAKARMLLVVHCENRTGTVIRIISARKATPRERRTAFDGGGR